MHEEERIESEYAAMMGIDWAEERHAICLREVGSNKVEALTVDQKAEALQDWLNGLRARFGGRRIAVALEGSRGGLLYVLMGCEFIVLYPINPKSLSRYREAFHSSGAKDDPKDAELLLRFLEAHRQHLRAWVPEDAQTRKLRMLVEFRRKLVDEGTAVANQLRSILKGYYPQFLELVFEIKTGLVCDLLGRWPSLDAMQKAKPEQIKKVYAEHNCRNEELFQKRVADIRKARPLITDEAIISASVLMVQALVKQLRDCIESAERFDTEIQKVFEKHPNRALCESLPGAGPALSPRLAVALGADRDRYQTPVELQQFSGIAPVTERSGKRCWVHWRRGCPKFLRQTFQEFARVSAQYCLWARAFYLQKRLAGKSHQATLRALAYKWIRIVFRCWQEGTVYQEKTYLDALKRRNSPLLASIQAHADSGNRGSHNQERKK